MDALYDVTVRTKEGYLAYEYRMTMTQMENSRMHKEISHNPKYSVSLKFLGAA